MTDFPMPVKAHAGKGPRTKRQAAERRRKTEQEAKRKNLGQGEQPNGLGRR